ncbi:MAG: peptide ABC transporter substrate-binding protein [Candidatus Promineifilaceae bacterium]
MKINIRWQLLLAVICLGLVVSLLSYQVQSVGGCTTRVPSSGGRLAVGIVGRPDKINPLLQSNNPVDQELVDLIFDGLIRYDDQGFPEGALAEDWSASEDGKTITIELKEGVLWHDGQAFTSEDVAFTYGLLQEGDFPAPDSLKELWSTIVISPTGEYSLDLVLPQPYGPIVDALTIGILPAHLLEDIPPAQLADNGFNSQPVGTGPFAASKIYNWKQTGNLRLVPNPDYWRNQVQIDTLDYYFYPDFQTLIEAYRSGTLQAISGIGADEIPEALKLPSIRMFTSPDDVVSMLLFNLDSDSSPLIQSTSGRRAVAEGTNRPQLIDAAAQGQGLVVDGPYVPESWAYDADQVREIPYSAESAAAALDEQGWILPEGSPVREKEGEPLVLRLLAMDDNLSRQLATELVDQWTALGITTEPRFVPPQDMNTALAESSFDIALVHVRPNEDPDLYDFWSQEAIVDGQNYGVWNSRQASEALEAGRQAFDIDERLLHYAAFQQIYNEELPAFPLFQHVRNFAISDKVEKVEIGLTSQPRDRYRTLSDWFMLYREVPVACPESEA